MTIEEFKQKVEEAKRKEQFWKGVLIQNGFTASEKTHRRAAHTSSYFMSSASGHNHRIKRG